MPPIIIASQPPLLLRLLGAVVMAGGLYFLKTFFFTDLLASLKDPGFFPGGLIGLLVILVLGLAITLGGALAAFASKRTVIDPLQHTVRVERGLFMFNRTDTWPFTDFTEVLNLWHAEQGDRQTTQIYDIELLRKNGQPVNINVFSKHAGADALAQSLGTLLRLPVTSLSREEWMRR